MSRMENNAAITVMFIADAFEAVMKQIIKWSLKYYLCFLPC